MAMIISRGRSIWSCLFHREKFVVMFISQGEVYGHVYFTGGKFMVMFISQEVSLWQ